MVDLLLGEYKVTKEFSLLDFRNLVLNNEKFSGSITGVFTEDYFGKRPNHNHPVVDFGIEELYIFRVDDNVVVDKINHDTNNSKYRFTKINSCCPMHRNEILFTEDLFLLTAPYIENYLVKQ